MQALLEYAIFTVHTLLDWLPRLSSLKHTVGGIKQYLFHKNDTPKQAAIGRAALSVCEQQQQQAVEHATARFIDRNTIENKAFAQVFIRRLARIKGTIQK